MRLTAVTSTVNHNIAVSAKKANEIASNPAAVKKVLQLLRKTFALWDLIQTNEIQRRPITDAFKGTTDTIKFYGTFKNMLFWLNLFGKEKIDQGILLSSLSASLSDPQLETNLQSQEKINQIYQELMSPSKNYYSTDEVREALQSSLTKQGFQKEVAQKIAQDVKIQQKARPIIQLLYMACFTVADIGGNVLILKKWNVINLSNVALSIGSQSRVFMFVVDLGAGTVLGAIASAGLILTTGESSYRLLITSLKYYEAADPQQKEQAYEELKNALVDLFVSGTDLVATAIPIIFTVSPLMFVSFALVAKGTGLVAILRR